MILKLLIFIYQILEKVKLFKSFRSLLQTILCNVKAKLSAFLDVPARIARNQREK